MCVLASERNGEFSRTNDVWYVLILCSCSLILCFYFLIHSLRCFFLIALIHCWFFGPVRRSGRLSNIRRPKKDNEEYETIDLTLDGDSEEDKGIVYSCLKLKSFFFQCMCRSHLLCIDPSVLVLSVDGLCVRVE